MAVQLANALAAKVEWSGLVCTRKFGPLQDELSDRVLSFTANKTSVFDIKAFLRVKAFMKSNRITIIHAHSTSFFWGVMLKICYPKSSLIWHDHYGYRSKTSKKNNIALYFSSFYFKHIITVNQDLKQWASKNLNCKNIDFLPNFTSNTSNTKPTSVLKLKGNSAAFKIVQVANLRPQKDHVTALKAIQILIRQNFDITYHLIGDYYPKSAYYQSVKSFIKANDLENKAFIYGSQSGITGLLNQADLGLLSSYSEGLPVSLLEYIKAKLPVVVTDVGQCRELVGALGSVVDPYNEAQMAKAIAQTMENYTQAMLKASRLKEKLALNYDSEDIIARLIELYKKSLQPSKRCHKR